MSTTNYSTASNTKLIYAFLACAASIGAFLTSSGCSVCAADDTTDACLEVATPLEPDASHCSAGCVRAAVEHALSDQPLSASAAGRIADAPFEVSRLFQNEPVQMDRLEAALDRPASAAKRLAHFEIAEAIPSADRMALARTLSDTGSIEGRASGARILSIEARRNTDAADAIAELLTVERDGRVLAVILEGATEAVFSDSARPMALAAMRSLIESGTDEDVRGRALVATAVHTDDTSSVRNAITEGLRASSAVHQQFALNALDAVVERQLAAGDERWRAESALIRDVAYIMEDNRAPVALRKEARDFLERYWM